MGIIERLPESLLQIIDPILQTFRLNIDHVTYLVSNG